MRLPELQLNVDQRMLYTKNVHTKTSQLWISSVNKKYQLGPKLSINSSQTSTASHEANTYIHYTHKNHHRALQGTLTSSAIELFQH